MNPVGEELFDSSVASEQQNWTPDALAEIPACKGVLLFADSDHRPVQLLQTANLRRAARTKLFRQDEDISRKTDLSDLTARIFWRCCYNDFVTQATYIQFTHVLFEKHADDRIHLPRPCFSVIEMDSDLPYFNTSDNPTLSDHRIVYGLFPNRKASAAFSKTLNSVFCLCQNPTLLKTGRESSCPYLQMQRCPGPCLNPAQKESYFVRVHKALEGANGRIQTVSEKLRRQMSEAANARDFENAAELKKKIVQLDKLRGPNYRWVHNLRDLSILHTDKGVKQSVDGKKRKIQHYKWLKITSGAVFDLGDFLPESHEDIERFLERNWTTSRKISYARNPVEHLGNIAYFLFRSKPSGFWLDCANGIRDEALYSGLNEQLGIL